MRFLAIGPRVYLGAMFLSLQREGHDVRVFAADPPAQRALTGIIDTVDDWRDHLGWVGRDGVIVFEGVGQGAAQQALREQGYRVVGGSVFGDRLENDRDFGQSVLRGLGMPIAASHPFETPGAAIDWLATHPGRYVLKHDNSAHATFVGDHPAGADVAFRLRAVSTGRVQLMERLDGVEVGVGAYFDGEKFLRPACIDFEHKRFFPGDLGEMTGEMGTLAAYDHAETLFAATLDRVAPLLRDHGHVGYVNLNTIVDERGIWPLEFTCRFGNPGFAILAAMQTDGWGDLLARMAFGGSTRFARRPRLGHRHRADYPPFPAWDIPCAPGDDPPIFFAAPPDDPVHHHYVDMFKSGGQLWAHKRSGHVMIVTGIGPTVRAAQEAARARARNVICPELRWRNDIGERFLAGEGEFLRARGLLPADAAW